MQASFDTGHQMRVIKLEPGPEFDSCVEVAKMVEGMADAPHEAVSTAGFIISLANFNVGHPDDLPPFCGHDADGLIISLDIARRKTQDEGKRMKVISLLEQVRASVDVDDLIAA